MWWNKRYINRRDWILENLGMLELTAEQSIVVLMIDYMNEHDMSINPMEISKRTGLDAGRVDEVVHGLMRQNLLEVKPGKGGFDFNIDNIFQDGIRYEYVNQNIFEVFESEFARPLSQAELERLNSWLGQYTQEEIVSALRTAIVYRKVSMPYINTILSNNRKEKEMF